MCSKVVYRWRRTASIIILRDTLWPILLLDHFAWWRPAFLSKLKTLASKLLLKEDAGSVSHSLPSTLLPYHSLVIEAHPQIPQNFQFIIIFPHSVLGTRNNISMCSLNNNETFCSMHYNRMPYHSDTIQFNHTSAYTHSSDTETRACSMQKQQQLRSNAAKCCNYWAYIVVHDNCWIYSNNNQLERDAQTHSFVAYIQAHGCFYSHIRNYTYDKIKLTPIVVTVIKSFCW